MVPSVGEEEEEEEEEEEDVKELRGRGATMYLTQPKLNQSL